jgi:hypothetical protein
VVEVEHELAQPYGRPGVAALRVHEGGEPQSGSAESLAALFRADADEGVSNLQVSVNATTVAGIEQPAPILERPDRGERGAAQRR